MERVLSQDERIRRAEEIYARRRIQAESRKSATVNVDNVTENKLTKKLIIQFILCTLLYIIIYAIKCSPNVMSKEVMYKIEDILEYDINIQEIYNNVNSYISSKEENIEQETETIEEEPKDNVQELEQTELVEETLGVAEVVDENIEQENQDNIEDTNKTQMEIDADFIKANYSIIKPLEGEITSRFGARESTNVIVSKYHTGIDIARVTGTVIIAAMDGIVEEVSSEGAYGKHIKISNGEVSTLYAHCSTMYVTEGQQITQGEQIGEVGETGNATGPHLHFEIRRNDEYVNPDMILQF